MGKWQVLAQHVLHAFHIRADVFRGGGGVGENHVGVGHEHHRDDDILAQFADEIKNFIGGHPMTGSEKTGYANSDSSYLKDAYYILTPTEEVPAEYTSWLKNFIITAGSHCEIMDYKTHDNVTAAISHCPHIISASLINTVAVLDDDGKYGRLAAGGLKDITRISSSSPEMWQNICLSNPDAIVSFLNRYIATLTNAKEAVISGDSDKLMQFFESAKKYRDKL